MPIRSLTHSEFKFKCLIVYPLLIYLSIIDQIAFSIQYVNKWLKVMLLFITVDRVKLRHFLKSPQACLIKWITSVEPPVGLKTHQGSKLGHSAFILYIILLSWPCITFGKRKLSDFTSSTTHQHNILIPWAPFGASAHGCVDYLLGVEHKISN